MKKKWLTGGCAVLVILLLGLYFYSVYFMKYDFSMADQTVLTADGCHVNAGVDGDGEIVTEDYLADDGTKGVSLKAEDSDKGFFMWLIDGKYEAVRGSTNSKEITIIPASDVRVVALYNDGKNLPIAHYKIVSASLNVGFIQTLKLFGVTLLGAMPLGLLIAFGTMSRFKPLSGLMRVLVWIIRGTPLMLQLLIIFYFPGLAFGKQLWGGGETGRFIASSVAFIINYACYFSEIYRGGIQGVPHGQREAGQVLGLSGVQIFFRVTLLQMIKRIVPPMANEIITLVKDTSLARIIALQEIIWAGQAFMKGSQHISGAIWPLFFTGVYYLAFSGLLTVLFGWVEKKLSYFKA